MSDSDSRRSSPHRDSDSSSDASGLGSLTQIYTEAVEFERVLKSTDCLDLEFSPTNANDEDDDDSANHAFAHLVGRDLNSKEQAIARRVAQLAKASETDVTWFPAELTEEPEAYSEESSEKQLSCESLDDKDILRFQEQKPADVEGWKLEPDEIIKLLEEEFGSLAVGDEKEELILEGDGCMYHDVLILGVIHVTTHRLAFHASLLSTRPDLLPSQRIIKSGPAVAHRQGWHVKRRIWIELSHDVLCAYTSSSEEARIRPLYTLLLSHIQEVLVTNPKHPRYLEFILTTNLNLRCSMEFDTVESAREWRRELTAAIFMYRHKRKEVMARSAPETDSGIRISCPLDRIEMVKPCTPSEVLRSIYMQASPESSSEFVSKPFQILHLGMIEPMAEWSNLELHIDKAKQRVKLTDHRDSTVFVDFGSLSFAEDNLSKPNLESVSPKELEFRSALGLGAEPEVWIARARIYRTIASSGYFAVSTHFVAFWSKMCSFGDIRYRLPLTTLKRAKPRKIRMLPVYGLSLEIEGHSDLVFEFWTAEIRDEAMNRINALIKLCRDLSTESLATPPPTPLRTPTSILSPPARAQAVVAAGFPPHLNMKLPKVINIPHQVLPSMRPLHFACLTIGSRGDVQPYIALGLGLKKEGHRVTIVTHDEFKDWVEGFGLEHRQAGGDPGALMKLSVENKMFSPEFFKESIANFRPWLDQLLLDAWESCQGADVLLESPSAMAGVHIAEALKIPYFRTFTMPWTKTTEFPHAFLSPPVESPTFNSASYILFSNVMWAATSGQINRWRRKTLNIGTTDMGHLAQSKIIFIYNFSQAVVPKPLDWGDTTIISGYWFLDNPDLGWQAPPDLLLFMDKARADGKPIVYIGFGSITVPSPNHVTTRLIKAVLKSGVRAIISKGWSARMSKADEKGEPEPEIPPECYMLEKVPHDWLFPQVDAVLHHGGAGTTGASLRAGVPTLIKPWFGDQFFWASRVHKLGAGMRVNLRVNDLSEALIKATSSRIMKEKAAAVGARIREEDGVTTAISTIYTYLHRASRNRTLLGKDD